jgi:hypothetical protein
LYDKYYNGDNAVKNVLPKPGDDDENVNVSKGGGDDSKEPNFLHVLIQKLKDFTEE